MVHETGHWTISWTMDHGPWVILNPGCGLPHALTTVRKATISRRVIIPHHVWPPRQAPSVPSYPRSADICRYEIHTRLFRSFPIQRLCSSGSEVCRHIAKDG